MAQGNSIVLTSPFGRKLEGTISGTPKPGTVMQIQQGTALIGGRATYEAYDRDGDGERPRGPILVLDIDELQGKTATDAYATGEHGFLWIPIPGDELNMLFKNISGTGTGDEVDVGDMLTVDDSSGKLIRAEGSSESPATPEIEPFVSYEAETDVTADVLIHCMFSGY